MAWSHSLYTTPSPHQALVGLEPKHVLRPVIQACIREIRSNALLILIAHRMASVTQCSQNCPFNVLTFLPTREISRGFRVSVPHPSRTRPSIRGEQTQARHRLSKCSDEENVHVVHLSGLRVKVKMCFRERESHLSGRFTSEVVSLRGGRALSGRMCMCRGRPLVASV